MTYRGVDLAKKSIWKSSQQEIEEIKSEARIGQKLRDDKHIIRLIGTYEGSAHGGFSFHILTFPVAVCNLDQLLDDVERLRNLSEMGLNEFSDLTKRLVALEIPGNRSIEKLTCWDGSLCRLLRATMGCLASTMTWMHASGVEHRDLKPQNILLRPGFRLYITDFGISRDRSLAARTTTESTSGHTWGYSAPEVSEGNAINPAQADVYSLGAVMLHIAVAMNILDQKPSSPSKPDGRSARAPSPLAHSRMACSEILHGPTLGRDKNIDKFLGISATGTDTSSLSLLIRSMLVDERTKRPTMAKVNETLLSLGRQAGVDFHARCCKPEEVAPGLEASEIEEFPGWTMVDAEEKT